MDGVMDKVDKEEEENIGSTKNNHHEKKNDWIRYDRYNILLEFAYHHLDFQRAELESVLSMHGIIIGKEDSCMEFPIPNNHTNEKDYPRPFIILSFPYDSEIIASVSNNNNNPSDMDDCNDDDDDDYVEDKVEQDLSEKEVQNKDKKPTLVSILSRCTLIRSVVELWGVGMNIEDCAYNCSHHLLGQQLDENGTVKVSSSSSHSRMQMVQRQMREDKSWKITIHTLGSKYTREEQNEMRAHFSFLEFPGEVKMKNPTNEFILIREVELDRKGSPLYPRHGLTKNIIPENDARPPLAVYFGRILGGRRDWRSGGRLEQYTLRKRTYLGPTSMDSELSLIMTNLAKVQKGSFCFDPFVGTGSILLTCALRGAYCFGTDIDIRVLRGRSREENIFTNFQQYNMQRPELVRSDNAIYHRHYRTHKPLYDAIVCDPPYGIRAGARKTGPKLGPDSVRPIPDEHRHDHIAQTLPYSVSDVMADLLDMSARTLVMGGRLVYIIPSMRDFDPHTDLPQHPCLQPVHICYQPLQIQLGRRIVALEKVQEYDETRRTFYMSNIWVNGIQSAEKCANIRDRLLEAAKLKPDYEQKAAFRKQKRKATRDAKKKAKREALLQLETKTNTITTSTNKPTS